MRKSTAALLASVSIFGIVNAAWADENLSQIRVVPVSPLKRTDLVGLIGEPTTITFPKGQSIYRVVQTAKPTAAGVLGAAGWQGPNPKDLKDGDTPLGNNLTLWPVTAGESTMSVITMTPAGVQTVYPFRLMALPEEADASKFPGVVLNLIFDDALKDKPQTSSVSTAQPITQSGAPARVVLDKRRAAEAVLAQERIRTDAFNGADGECHYHPHGVKPNPIEPRCPMDNGQWTLMRFPGLSQKPAVFVVTGPKDEDERRPNQHGDGDFIVVEDIAKHFRLRLGLNVLDIINDAYDPAGRPTGTGTISTTAEREIIQAKRQ